MGYQMSSKMSSIEEELQKLKEALNLLAETLAIRMQLLLKIEDMLKLKFRLKLLVEALRSENVYLENRLQVMQNENERLQRELETMRELRSNRELLHSDQIASEIPRMDRGVEENASEKSESLEQAGQTVLDQISDKLDVSVIQVAEGKTAQQGQLVVDDDCGERNSDQVTALCNNENDDFDEERRSLLSDDIQRDAEDLEPNIDDTSDMDEVSEGSKQAVNRQMMQRNDNQENTYFD
ncbi:hypothetical protein KIN20_021352 [Parelaphostrongylus tenuis]|uniref:Uncharacterized protein n=1 Tax=Parelaphostrongylus tenuis TaxID=148309 RepID=A0AAD5QUG4_PARTN|nr:hypothetical protein KIN20_021352 [Parelaphostrongylus tenuis]